MTIEPIRVETRSLPTHLVGDDLMDRADELATTVQAIAAEEERQKNLKDQMKAAMSELTSRQTRLALAVSRREEYRDVEVEITISVDGGNVREVRRDDGELIVERPPRERERQMFLKWAEDHGVDDGCHEGG